MGGARASKPQTGGASHPKPPATDKLKQPDKRPETGSNPKPPATDKLKFERGDPPPYEFPKEEVPFVVATSHQQQMARLGQRINLAHDWED